MKRRTSKAELKRRAKNVGIPDHLLAQAQAVQAGHAPAKPKLSPLALSVASYLKGKKA